MERNIGKRTCCTGECGDVEDWLEMMLANQSHVYEYYDVAQSKLAIHHLNLAKKLVNEIIESIKHGHFRTNVRANLIMKGKLALDMLNWEEKRRKAIISEEINLNTSSESEK